MRNTLFHWKVMKICMIILPNINWKDNTSVFFYVVDVNMPSAGNSRMSATKHENIQNSVN